MYLLNEVCQDVKLKCVGKKNVQTIFYNKISVQNPCAVLVILHVLFNLMI